MYALQSATFTTWTLARFSGWWITKRVLYSFISIKSCTLVTLLTDLNVNVTEIGIKNKNTDNTIFEVFGFHHIWLSSLVDYVNINKHT